jgi:hypothetical protein
VGYYDHPAAAARVQPDQEFDADRVALIASWRKTLVVTQIEPFAGIDPG